MGSEARQDSDIWKSLCSPGGDRCATEKPLKWDWGTWSDLLMAPSWVPICQERERKARRILEILAVFQSNIIWAAEKWDLCGPAFLLPSVHFYCILAVCQLVFQALGTQWTKLTKPLTTSKLVDKIDTQIYYNVRRWQMLWRKIQHGKENNSAILEDEVMVGLSEKIPSEQVNFPWVPSCTSPTFLWVSVTQC